MRHIDRRRAELFSAIGEFIYWFSELEHHIRLLLVTQFGIDGELFETVTGPYDFPMLCKVTEKAVCREQTEEKRKEIKSFFNSCQRLNQGSRVIIAHGHWSLGGARHFSRQRLESEDLFRSPEEILDAAATAKELSNRAFSLMLQMAK